MLTLFLLLIPQCELPITGMGANPPLLDGEQCLIDDLGVVHRIKIVESTADWAANYLPPGYPNWGSVEYDPFDATQFHPSPRGEVGIYMAESSSIQFIWRPGCRPSVFDVTPAMPEDVNGYRRWPRFVMPSAISEWSETESLVWVRSSGYQEARNDFDPGLNPLDPFQEIVPDWLGYPADNYMIDVMKTVALFAINVGASPYIHVVPGTMPPQIVQGDPDFNATTDVWILVGGSLVRFDLVDQAQMGFAPGEMFSELMLCWWGAIYSTPRNPSDGRGPFSMSQIGDIGGVDMLHTQFQALLSGAIEAKSPYSNTNKTPREFAFQANQNFWPADYNSGGSYSWHRHWYENWRFPSNPAWQRTHGLPPAPIYYDLFAYLARWPTSTKGSSQILWNSWEVGPRQVFGDPLYGTWHDYESHYSWSFDRGVRPHSNAPVTYGDSAWEEWYEIGDKANTYCERLGDPRTPNPMGPLAVDTAFRNLCIYEAVRAISCVNWTLNDR